MLKYVVSWIIVYQTLIPCPQKPKTEDEFGRIPPHTMTAEACFKWDTVYKSKPFSSRQEAIDFIKRGQDNKANGNFLSALTGAGALSNFKLDSLSEKSILRQ